MQPIIDTGSKYRVSLNLYYISLVFFTLISITTSIGNPAFFVQALSSTVLSIVSIIILTTTKNYKLPVYIMVFASIAVHLIGFVTKSFVENQGDIFWIIVMAIFTFYTLGKNWATAYLIISIGSMAAIKLLTTNNIVPLIISEEKPCFASELNYLLNLVACCILFIYLVGQIIKEYETTQKKLLTTNSKLSLQDAEKTTMLKEIHHRVKNNLQVIISLLRLQLFQLENDDKVSGPFQDSINRISTMALIHEKMYKGDKINNLDIENYISDLTADIVDTYATTTNVNVAVRSNIEPLKMDDLVPFSLILNELITNSIKHGFANKKDGNINIHLKKTDIGFDFTYKDSGEWKENYSKQKFGLELIETLNGHFDGDFHKDISAEGTEFHFHFKVY